MAGSPVCVLQNLVNQVDPLSFYTQQTASGTFLIFTATIRIYLTRTRNR